MGMNLVDIHDALEKRRTFGVFDDFEWFISPHRWTSVLTDSGTAAVGDASKGILVLTPSDGTVADNDEAYVRTTNEVLLIAENKPIVVEGKIQFTETAAGVYNAFVGCLDAIGADTLVDNGAGMKTTFSGAAIYKVDGGTVWKCISSKSTTQTISTSTTSAGGSSYQTLRVEIRPVSSTVAEVTFWVDDQQLIDSTSNKPIKHTMNFTSATEMHVGAGCKLGAGTNNDVLNIDYLAWEMLR